SCRSTWLRGAGPRRGALDATPDTAPCSLSLHDALPICPQQHAPLAAIARHFTKGKAQRCWDQEDRQHLHEVGQCGWVFKRMRRVGIKEATAVSTEHLDRFLRSYRPHG